MNPDNYVQIQRLVNSAHLDGRQEAEFEEARYHTRNFVKWLRDKALPAESFLDAGCRTGYAMEEFTTLIPSCDVTGIDIVPEFIKVAENRGDAVVGDLQAMPFEDEQFDWTFSCTAIEHCPDIKAAISEMQRVSKIGFYVHTDLEDEQGRLKNASHFVNHENPTEWVDEFKNTNWWLVYLNVPRKNRVEMIWMQKQACHKYLIKKDF